MTIPTVATATAPEADPSPWPTSEEVQPLDAASTLGSGLSGVSVAPDGSLWAVRDENGQLLHLRFEGEGVDEFAPLHASVRFPGSSAPADLEAVTVDDLGTLYVAAERDHAAEDRARDAVLELDLAPTDGTVTVRQVWDLDTLLHAAEPNRGVEGLAWVPDRVLVEAGFLDDGTGGRYRSEGHPGHGGGVFVVGSEPDGVLHVLVLGQDGAVAQLAELPTGMTAVTDVFFDEASAQLWAICDNRCNDEAVRLEFNRDEGRLVVRQHYRLPAPLQGQNIEGFTIVGSCQDARRAAVWADDGAHRHHALWLGTADCGATATRVLPVGLLLTVAGLAAGATGAWLRGRRTRRAVQRPASQSRAAAKPSSVN